MELQRTAWSVCNIYKFIWKYCHFPAIWIFYADGEQIQKFLGNCSEQSGFESSGRDISTAYESGMF